MKESLQYDMILKLVQIKAVCDDTAKAVISNNDSIVSNNIQDIEDILETLRDTNIALAELLIRS